MILETNCNVVGCSSGQGQNGAYYNIAVVVDGEAHNLSCTLDVFNLAKNLTFGEDRKLIVDLRRYGRDWAVRVTGLDEYLE